ncbi:MAG: serine/threonine-protein kinase PknK [Planctomycetaceae bacterium]
MHQLRCHHGHRFDVTAAAGQRVVCPLCGSVTTPKAELHTPAAGPLDGTRVVSEPVSVQGRSASAQTQVSGATILNVAQDITDEDCAESAGQESGQTVITTAQDLSDDDSAEPAGQESGQTVITTAQDLSDDDCDEPAGQESGQTVITTAQDLSDDDCAEPAGQESGQTVITTAQDIADGDCDEWDDQESGQTVITATPPSPLPLPPMESPGLQDEPTLRSLADVPNPPSLAGPNFRTSSMTFSGQRSTVAMQTEIDITEPPNLPGYKVLGELGRGGMGVVYRVYDEKLDRHVALKTLQRISPVGLQRFKQEFRSLADVSHPNLAGPYDLLSDGQTWCFTMEILEAVDFLEYVWSGFEKLQRDKGQPLMATGMDAAVANAEPRLSPAIRLRLDDGLKQLALGLHALHEAGVLHRDIKPSNILVTTEGRVVLVDFGLAAQIAGDGRSQGIQGTPDYMAPEQAAGKPVTPASDWYAVGVMLHELLTGRMPIEGKAMQVIFKKQKETPKQPRELEPTVPPELNDLCVALLQRDATKRPSVFDVLRLIGADDVAATIRGKTVQRTSQALELVGRERHLDILRDVFEQVRSGSTRSVFVHGKSGMGKSVLIQSFLEELKNTSRSHTRQSVGSHVRANVATTAVVLMGRCYEQESVPFKALDSLIDSLAAHLGKLPEAVARQAVPEDSLPLVRLFPVLGQMPGATDAGRPSIDNVDQQELRQRAMNALRELLRWLGAQQPVVLYIDDLQWGDVDSAVLLGDLMRPPESPRVLLLGSYRSEYIETSLCLKELATAYSTGQVHPHRQELAVEALEEHDATHLALLLLKRDDKDSLRFAAKIAKESGGWPFFVWELVQHVQEAPEVADQTLELDEVIWTRVSRLPEETRRLLELIAVAGRPIVSAEAYRALEVGAKGQNLLVQLRTRNFIRATEAEDESTIVESYHDRIRESVVKHLNEPTKQGLNRKLAKTILQLSGISAEQVWTHLKSATPFAEPTAFFHLERQQWRRVFDLTHYLAAAGELDQALPFALIAAEQARQQNALEVAEQQYRIALSGTALAAGHSAKNIDPASPVASAIPLSASATQAAQAIRFRILEGLGDVLVLRAKYVEAREQFEAALAMTQDNLISARLGWKLGTASFKKGDMGDSLTYLEQAIAKIDHRPPSALTVVPRLIKEAVVQVLHTKFPARFVGKNDPKSPQGQMDLFRARIYENLTLTYWFTRGMKFVLWSHMRQMNLAERYPPSPELGKTYAFHAIAMTGLPLARRGINYAERAYQISVDNGDLWGQGKARSFHTFSCIVLASFQEGIRTGSEAIRLLEGAGDIWEANMARMIMSVPMYHAGDLKGAYREARKAYEIGIETGDYSAACISLLFWMPAAPHLVPPGAIKTEMERDRVDPLAITSTFFTRGLELLLCEDKPQEAADMFQKMLNEANRREFRDCCLYAAMTWKVTALRIVAERAAEGSARRRALRYAKRALRAALSKTKSYRACRPHALREGGILATLEGDEKSARQFFEESLQVAQQHAALFDLAKTQLARGEAGLKFGWPDAESQVQQARAQIAEIENVDESTPAATAHRSA